MRSSGCTLTGPVPVEGAFQVHGQLALNLFNVIVLLGAVAAEKLLVLVKRPRRLDAALRLLIG